MPAQMTSTHRHVAIPPMLVRTRTGSNTVFSTAELATHLTPSLRQFLEWGVSQIDRDDSNPVIGG